MAQKMTGKKALLEILKVHNRNLSVHDLLRHA